MSEDGRNKGGRPPGIPQAIRTRQKIQATKLAERLQLYALGERDCNGHIVNMTAGQVRAAEILIDRVVPKLAQVQLTEKLPTAEDMSDEELAAFLTGENPLPTDTDDTGEPD